MADILNPFVDIVKARRDFRDFNWAVVDDLFDKSFAEKMIQNIVRNTQFSNVFLIENNRVEMSDEELNALEQQHKQQLFQEIHTQASDGIGFLYAQKRLTESNETIEIGAVKQAFDWLSSDNGKDYIADITGNHELSRLTCEVCRFSQGQFLFEVPEELGTQSARVGFILELTPNWQTSWGGLLHLHGDTHESQHYFVPQFNQMILFDANLQHSISLLAPFIKFYKYALIGWYS